MRFALSEFNLDYERKQTPKANIICSSASGTKTMSRKTSICRFEDGNLSPFVDSLDDPKKSRKKRDVSLTVGTKRYVFF